jgi:hypothetical protein
MKCFFNCCVFTCVIASWSHMLMNVVVRSVFNLQGADYTPPSCELLIWKKPNNSPQYLPHKWFPLQSLTLVPTNIKETNENIQPDNGLPGEAGLNRCHERCVRTESIPFKAIILPAFIVVFVIHVIYTEVRRNYFNKCKTIVAKPITLYLWW